MSKPIVKYDAQKFNVIEVGIAECESYGLKINYTIEEQV